jgi:hypothetical protein
MKIFHILVGLVIILLFTGFVSAVESPYNITLTKAPKEWIIANGIDTVSLTAHVANITDSSNVSGQSVQFYVNPSMGSISPATLTTGSDGNVTTTFRTKTVSGSAIIQVYLANNQSVNSTVTQKIDHNDPYQMTVNFPDAVNVGSNATIIAGLFDKYGNRIDLRRDNETGTNGPQLRFAVTSPGSNASFQGSWNGQNYNDTVIFSSPTSGLYVNGTGQVVVNLKVSNLIGNNIVTINPLTSIPDRYFTITGVTVASLPEVMEITVNPNRLYQPNDNKSRFSITYLLFDESGNRLNGKNIFVTADRIDPETGEVLETFGQSTVTTTAAGPAVYLFPPKTEPMYVRVLAVSQDNENLTGSSLIEFYQPGPAFLGLTAMPDIMPSKDVATSVNSSIMAKVTDQKSIAVPNMTVNFTITPLDYPVVQTTVPFLGTTIDTQTLSIVTNQDGKAETIFNPGTFNISGHQLFSANCTLGAEVMGHPGIAKSHIMTWKNFPFISVTTSVSNSTNLSVNDTIDVTIKIQGEGMEIAYREPMDVVLATSRSKSMMQEDPNDRMIYAYIAERLFIDKITQTYPYTGSDMIGLLTYGGDPNGIPLRPTKGNFKWTAGIDNTDSDDDSYISNNYLGSNVPKKTYYDESTWEVPPTSDYDSIRNAINYTVPYGGDDNRNEEPLRKALYDSITQLRNTTNQDKVIIALVDSQTNDYGNILAKGQAVHTVKINEGNRYYAFSGPDGSWGDYDPNQNMATYAQNSGVKIYVIYAPSQLNQADRSDFITLAQLTGGAYNETENDASKLPGIYDWIADTILKEAAINATMTINMGTIKVNQVDIIQNETPVFDYVFVPGESTHIQLLKEEDGTTQTIREETIDQTSDYSDKILTFVVGTVKLHEIWQADYRLRILMEAEDIDIFGNGSVISFENLGSDISYQLQTISISVPTEKTSKEETYDLVINDFRGFPQGEYVLLDWDLTYTGPNITSNDVTAEIFYKDRYGNMESLHNYTGLKPPYGSPISIPKNILPPDTDWMFKIVANAYRAPERIAYWPELNPEQSSEANPFEPFWPFGPKKGSIVLY